MFTVKRPLALLTASAIAAAGFAVVAAPPASAATALPAGCVPSYTATVPATTTIKAGAVSPAAQVTLANTPECSGAQVINLITITAAMSPGIQPSDLKLQAGSATAGWQDIPLRSQGSGFVGIWGPPAGFSLPGSDLVTSTQFSAPAGKYTVSVQLAEVTNTGSYQPIDGTIANLGVYTAIAAPVVTAADKDLRVGGTARPASAVSGTPDNPQADLTYTFNGNLPEGVSFTGGTFKADATADPGDTVTGTMTATDGLDQRGTSPAFTLTITAAAEPTIAGDADMWGVAGKPFTNSSVKATGGIPPYTFDWDIDPADAKDLGLSINATTGAITGTIGNYMLDEPVQIGVQDAADGTDVYTTTLHVLAFDVAGSSVTDNTITCQVGKPFAVTFTSGGLGGHAGTYSADKSLSGSGITLSKDGKLAGTPTSCEFLNAAYTLTDTVDGRAFTQTFTGEGLTPVVQNTESTGNGLADTGMSQGTSLIALALACLALGIGGYVVSRRLRRHTQAS